MKEIIQPQQPKDAFERLEKFQSLSAGQFWRALTDVPKYAIKQDTVLLIESIAWVDNQPHTISVRAHPDQYGQHLEVEWTDEQGQNRQGYVTCKTHDFRISSFLQQFEFEPAHEQIRQRELAAAQGRVFALQQDLVDTQSSPEKMAKLIAEGLEEFARKSANSNPAGQLPIAIDHSARVPQNLSSFLSSGITESSIAVMKAQAERSHTIATIQGNWITWVIALHLTTHLHCTCPLICIRLDQSFASNLTSTLGGPDLQKSTHWSYTNGRELLIKKKYQYMTGLSVQALLFELI